MRATPAPPMAPDASHPVTRKRGWLRRGDASLRQQQTIERPPWQDMQDTGEGDPSDPTPPPEELAPPGDDAVRSGVDNLILADIPEELGGAAARDKINRFIDSPSRANFLEAFGVSPKYTPYAKEGARKSLAEELKVKRDVAAVGEMIGGGEDTADTPDAGQASGPPTAPVAVQGDGGRMVDFRSGAGTSWPSSAGLGAARSRADRLGVEIGDLDSRIKAAGYSIERSESKVKSYSKRFREQNPDKFKNAVDAHNALIERFNSLLEDRQEKYGRYEKQAASAIAMFDRYDQASRSSLQGQLASQGDDIRFSEGKVGEVEKLLGIGRDTPELNKLMKEGLQYEHEGESHYHPPDQIRSSFDRGGLLEDAWQALPDNEKIQVSASRTLHDEKASPGTRLKAASLLAERKTIDGRTDALSIVEGVAERAPFTPSVLGITEHVLGRTVDDAVEKINAGTATTADYQRLAESMEVARIQGNKSILAKVLNTLSYVPGYMAEMYYTGGALKAAQLGLKLKRLHRTYKATTAAQKALRAVGAGKRYGKLALHAARHPVMIPRAVDTVLDSLGERHFVTEQGKHEIKTYILDPGITAENALSEIPKRYAKGIAGHYLEIFSEIALGGTARSLARILPPGAGKKASDLYQQMLKARVFTSWMNRSPSGGSKAFSEALKKGGYGGIIEEIGEEAFNDAARYAFKISSKAAWNPETNEFVIVRDPGSLGDLESFTVMSLAAAAPGAARAGLKMIPPTAEEVSPIPEQRWTGESIEVPTGDATPATGEQRWTGESIDVQPGQEAAPEQTDETKLPTFEYKAFDTEGNSHVGEIEAETAEKAEGILRGDGYFVESIEEKWLTPEEITEQEVDAAAEAAAAEAEAQAADEAEAQAAAEADAFSGFIGGRFLAAEAEEQQALSEVDSSFKEPPLGRVDADTSDEGTQDAPVEDTPVEAQESLEEETARNSIQELVDQGLPGSKGRAVKGEAPGTWDVHFGENGEDGKITIEEVEQITPSESTIKNRLDSHGIEDTPENRDKINTHREWMTIGVPRDLAIALEGRGGWQRVTGPALPWNRRRIRGKDGTKYDGLGLIGFKEGSKETRRSDHFHRDLRHMAVQTGIVSSAQIDAWASRHSPESETAEQKEEAFVNFSELDEGMLRQVHSGIDALLEMTGVSRNEVAAIEDRVRGTSFMKTPGVQEPATEDKKSILKRDTARTDDEAGKQEPATEDKKSILKRDTARTDDEAGKIDKANELLQQQEEQEQEGERQLEEEQLARQEEWYKQQEEQKRLADKEEREYLEEEQRVADAQSRYSEEDRALAGKKFKPKTPLDHLIVEEIGDNAYDEKIFRGFVQEARKLYNQQRDDYNEALKSALQLTGTPGEIRNKLAKMKRDSTGIGVASGRVKHEELEGILGKDEFDLAVWRIVEENLSYALRAPISGESSVESSEDTLHRAIMHGHMKLATPKQLVEAAWDMINAEGHWPEGGPAADVIATTPGKGLTEEGTTQKTTPDATTDTAPDAPEVHTGKSLKSERVGNLRYIAEKMGISDYSGKRKSELIKMILEAQATTTPEAATPAEIAREEARKAKDKAKSSLTDLLGGGMSFAKRDGTSSQRRKKFVEDLADYLFKEAKATGLEIIEIAKRWYSDNKKGLSIEDADDLRGLVGDAENTANERLKTEQPKEKPKKPKKPRKKPTPTPEGEFSEEVYSIKNASVDADLAALGLPQPTPGEELAFQEAMDEAVTATKADADSLVNDLLDNPRAPSPWEDALLTVAYKRAKQDYDKARQRAAGAAGKGGETENTANEQLQAALEKYEKVYMASRVAGRESGRSLAFRRMMIRDDYSLVSMQYEARIANKGELSKKQKEEVAELRKRIEELESELRDIETRNSNNKAEEKFKAEDKKIEKEVKKRKPRKARIVTDEAAAEARERIKKRLQSTATAGVDPAMIHDATLVGVNLIENGVNKFSAWSAQMVEVAGDTIKPHLEGIWTDARSQVGKLFVEETSSTLSQADKSGKPIGYNRQARRIYKEFRATQDMDTALQSTHEVFNDAVEEDFTIEQVRDFVSGYGVFKELSKEELEVQIRDDVGQYQQLAKIEAMLRGEAPKKTGVERREASDEERLLMKEVERLKKAGNYIDAEQTLKSAFASMKTRLENQIKDLDNARDLETPIDKRSKLQLTKEQQDEIDEITKRLDIAKELYKEMFPPETKKLDDQDRLAAAIKRTERRIETLEDHIERGVPMDEPSTVEPNEELRKLQDKRDKLTQKYRQMAPVKEAAEERKLAAALKQTEKSIEDLRNALETGKAIPKSAQPLVNDALNKLRAERDQLREQYKKRFPPAPKLLTDQQKLETAIKNTERSIEQLEQALKNKTPLERKQAGPTNKKLDALRKKRADLRTRYSKEIGAAQKLERDIKSAEQTIAEMEDALRTGKPLPKRPKGEVDPVLAKIHERRDEVRRRYREQFPPTRTTAQRIAYAEKALERTIERNKQRIRNKDIGPVKGAKAKSARLTALRAENDALLAELRALKPTLTQEQKDTRRKISALKGKIKRRKQALETGEWKTEQRQSEANMEDPTLKGLIAEEQKLKARYLAELGAQIELDQEKARVTRRIADKRDKIARGDFSTKKRTPRERKDDDELRQKRLEELELHREWSRLKAKYEWDNMAVTTKAGRVGWRLYDAVRAMKASIDTSGFRQAAFASLARPTRALRSGGKMFMGMWTEKQRLAIEDELKKNPYYDEAKSRGVAFTELGGDLRNTEEEYMFSATAFSGKTWKTLSYPYAVSERAFSTLLNVMRLEYYADIVGGLPLTAKEQGDIATHVNDATGRGGKGPSSVALTRIFWAPRLLISRWNLLTARSLRDPDVSVTAKKLIAKEYARAMRSVGVLLLLAAASRWGEDWDEDWDEWVSFFDPRSSKFATIKIGNTYVDPWGGMKQLAVFMARIGFREKRNWESELVPLDEGVYGQNVYGEISRFALTKLNPAAGLAVSVAQKHDMMGRPMTAGRVVFEATSPLAPVEAYVAIKEEGIAKGSFLGLLGMMGASLMIDDEEMLSSYEHIFGEIPKMSPAAREFQRLRELHGTED